MTYIPDPKLWGDLPTNRQADVTPESPVKKIKYLSIHNTTNNFSPILRKEFERWAQQDGHSNGHAQWWIVEDPKLLSEDNEYDFPLINQYFLDEGLHVGDNILLHSSW